jgi:hypothetical protein
LQNLGVRAPFGAPGSYPCRVQETPAAIRRIRAWVRAALSLESGLVWTPETADESIPDLIEAIRRHRVAELLGSQSDGLELPAALVGPIDAIRAASRRALMVQVLETDRLQKLFTNASIPSLAIKGPALAMQTAGDPSARGSGDVDLVVHPDRVEDAHRLLLASGWRIRPGYEVEPGTWAWRHVMGAFNALTYDGPSSSVDLHWRLDPTLDALPTFAEAWERRVAVDLGGVQVETLCHADLLAHSSLHAAKDSWRWMRSLIDVHRLAGDPRTWDRSLREEPLRKLEVRSLAVTQFIIGLPPGVPAEVLDQLDRVPGRVLSRALAAQDRPVTSEFPIPGSESLRLLRYMLAASHTPSDLRHAAVSTVLPGKSVIGVEAKSAWTGVPLTLWYRVRRLRRRSVAWARREPGAGVVDPLVRTPR